MNAVVGKMANEAILQPEFDLFFLKDVCQMDVCY